MEILYGNMIGVLKFIISLLLGTSNILVLSMSNNIYLLSSIHSLKNIDYLIILTALTQMPCNFFENS